MDTAASWNGDRRFRRWLGDDESLTASVEARVVFSDPETTGVEAAFVLALTPLRLLVVDLTDSHQPRLDASIPLDYLLRVWLEDFEESTDLVIRLTTGAYVRFEVSDADREAAADFCRHAAELAEEVAPPEPEMPARERILVGAAAAHVSVDGSDGYFLRVDRPDPPVAELSQCRHCGRHVRSDAVFCGWCGTVV